MLQPPDNTPLPGNIYRKTNNLNNGLVTHIFGDIPRRVFFFFFFFSLCSGYVKLVCNVHPKYLISDLLCTFTAGRCTNRYVYLELILFSEIGQFLCLSYPFCFSLIPFISQCLLSKTLDTSFRFVVSPCVTMKQYNCFRI
jgi:hypothetical protein